jgi:hypothetical protein
MQSSVLAQERERLLWQTQDLEALQPKQLKEDALIGVQNSRYIDSSNSYFIISIARPMYPISGTNTSVSVGVNINDTFKKTVNFWNDTNIPNVEVNESCEICPLANCESRAAQPLILENKQKAMLLDTALEKVINKLS